MNKVILTGWFEKFDEKELVFAYKVPAVNNRVEFMHVPIEAGVYNDLQKMNPDENCVVSLEGQISCDSQEKLVLIPISFSIDLPADHQKVFVADA